MHDIVDVRLQIYLAREFPRQDVTVKIGPKETAGGWWFWNNELQKHEPMHLVDFREIFGSIADTNAYIRLLPIVYVPSFEALWA